MSDTDNLYGNGSPSKLDSLYSNGEGSKLDRLRANGEGSKLGNPLEDLRSFAKDSMNRHEAMQMATRRESTSTKDREVKRTFVELAPPKGFADPPQKPRKGANIKDEGTELRFDILVKRKGTSPSFTYEVAVTHGRVAERIPGSGDAMAYYEPSNILDGSDLRLFAIADGQAIYVVVEQQADGSIGGGGVDGPVYLLVDADDKESIHYQPQVDTETTAGVAGTMYYKLAEFTISGGDLTVTKIMAGSNIDHYQELPKIKSTAAIGTDIGVIPKKWDDATGAYQLRALEKGLGQLGITTGADLIEIRGNKKSLDVYVDELDIESSTPVVQFVDGLETLGGDVVGDEGSPPAPEEVRIKIPQVKQRLTDPQVMVSDVGAATPVYKVEGNGNDGSLTINVDSVLAAELNWVDGLVTDSGTQTVDITTGGGSDLPDGTQGDMLYWNVVLGVGAWTLLTHPAAPASGNRTFLTHDGTTPAWVEMADQEIQICVAGTPTTKTIYVDI